jgi:hypothetical protein
MISRKMLTHRAKVYKTWHYFNKDILKISILLIFFLFCGLMTALPSFAQVARVEEQSAPSPSAEKEQQSGGESSKKETQQFVIRVRTKQKVDFSGTVTHVDPATATLSLRSQGKTITFDMSKVILIGYGNTGEIKKGDEVSVGYTQFGLQVQKGAFAITHRENIPRREVVPQKEVVLPKAIVPQQNTAPQKAVTRVDTTKPQRTTPIRMADNKHPTTFKDIDNNKDGKITPIELCVMLPDLTLPKFKEYDKNGDGYLNEREFSTVKRAK